MSAVHFAAVRWLLILVVLGVAKASRGEEPEVQVVAPGARSAVVEKVRNAEATHRQILRKRIDVEFDGTPLNEVLLEIGGRAGDVEIEFDEPALTADGVDKDVPVHLSAKGVTVGQALHFALDAHALTCFSQDGRLLVTTVTEAEEKSHLVTHTYDVQRIVSGIQKGLRSPNVVKTAAVDSSLDTAANSLVNLIQRLSRGPWQVVEGTGGFIAFQEGILTVRQQPDVHDEIAGMLQALQLCLDGKLKGGSAEVWKPWCPAADATALDAALARRIPKIELRQVPLIEAVDWIRQEAKVPVHLDRTALEADAKDELKVDGKYLRQPVTLVANDVSLGNALHRLLKPLELQAVPEHGVLRVTAATEADDPKHYRAVVYDVSDLTAAGLDETSLASLVQEHTSGPWQDVEGTGGDIDSPTRGCCVVRHLDSVHREIATLFDDLRKSLKDVAETKKAMAAEEAKHDGTVETKFYPLAVTRQADPLQKSIVEFVSPESWKGRGGEGQINAVDRVLVVRQTRAVHREIEKFLKDLAEAADESR